MMRVFIDSSAWYALVFSANKNHDTAKDYFLSLLESRARLYSTITEINQAIFLIKKECGLAMAMEFNKIIDEAALTGNIHVSWLTRRLRRNSLKHFFSFKETEIELRHCIIFEEIRKKRINIIFSFDTNLKIFGVPLMP
jgi:predicted nucleic acid-binding protein